MKKSIYFKYFFIFLIVLLVNMSGVIYSRNIDGVSSIWPLTGFYIAIFMYYRKESVVPLFFFLAISRIILQLVFFDDVLYVNIITSFLYALSNMVEIGLFMIILNHYKDTKYAKNEFIGILLYSITVTIAMAVGAIIPAITVPVFYGGESMEVYREWLIGNWFGMMIFGTLLLYGYSYYQKELQISNKKSYQVIYILLYFLLTYLLMSERISIFNFRDFMYIFFIFYIISAALFSYKVILYNNFVVLILFNLFYIELHQEMNLVEQVIILNLFLLSLTFTSIFVKRVLLTLYKKDSSLNTANKTLNKLIQDVNPWLNTFQVFETKKDFDRNFISKMFRIATGIFPNFDKASVYLTSGEHVEYVDSVGYDIKKLNEFKIKSKMFNITYEDPEIIDHKNRVRDVTGNLKRLVDDIDPINESIRFTLFSGNVAVGGMAFDLLEGSSKMFSEDELIYYKAFQDAINSYYVAGEVYYKNTVLRGDIVLSLVRTLELFDSYTGGHSEEVADLCRSFAKYLNLPNTQVQEIYWAGVVHDIGKVGISPEILNKVDELTDDEWKVVQSHSENGFRILSQSEELQSIANIVKHHHERFDGTGYPSKLKGHEIPFESQILCICDSVNAMLKKRVYSDEKSCEEIMVELQTQSGKQFSPELVTRMVQFISIYGNKIKALKSKD